MGYLNERKVVNLRGFDRRVGEGQQEKLNTAIMVVTIKSDRAGKEKNEEGGIEIKVKKKAATLTSRRRNEILSPT